MLIGLTSMLPSAEAVSCPGMSFKRACRAVVVHLEVSKNQGPLLGSPYSKGASIWGLSWALYLWKHVVIAHDLLLSVDTTWP